MSSLKTGLKTGLKTTWKLSKFIFPITVLVTVLQFTPILPFIIKLIAPLMGVIGLPGEAAIPLVLGNALNLYAGIAGILSLDLTVKEVFILATMLSFSHSFFIEAGVALTVGVRLWVVMVVRFGLAISSALMIHLFWHGGGEMANYGLVPTSSSQPDGWLQITWLGLEKASYGILQMAIIVIPLMIIVQFLRDYQYMQKLSKRLAPFTKIFGIQPNASMTFVAGLIVGLAYGAGLMIQAVEEDGVSRKDATLVFIFLLACHAIVEDTLIFYPLGIPILPLFLTRISVAFILTIIVARLWQKAEKNNEKEVLTS